MNHFASIAALVSMTTSLLACTSAPPEPAGMGADRDFSIQSAEGIGRGFRVADTEPTYSVGPNTRRVRELGFRKQVGDWGVLAVDEVNGCSRVIPHATSPLRLRKFDRSEMEHESLVMSYFKRRGFPMDQVGLARTNTLVESVDATDDKVRQPAQLVAYYTTFTRVIEGIDVVDSIAWARLDDTGGVVSETVYWPDIPKTVIEDAQRLQSKLLDAQQAATLRAAINLPGTPVVRAVIRHRSLSTRGNLEAVAAYSAVDVETKSTRNFDEAGREMWLNEEVELDRASPASVRKGTPANTPPAVSPSP